MTSRPGLPPVVRVSRWNGFCLPCDDDARPLVLTWSGRRGLRAWLAGEGWQDGALRLTCAVCGDVQAVGWQDEPEPERVEVPVEVAVPVPVRLPVEAAVPVQVPVQVQVAVPVEVAVPVRPPVSDVPVLPAALDLDLEAAVAACLAALPASRSGRAEPGAPTPAGTDDVDALDLLHLVA